MVILSDGDANADPSNLPTFATYTNCDSRGNCVTSADNLCQRAIANARAAATVDKIWVYSRQQDREDRRLQHGMQDVSMARLSACDTMCELASDSTKFYSDGSKSTECVGTGGSNTNLITLFQNISSDFTMPRLIPGNTV